MINMFIRFLKYMNIYQQYFKNIKDKEENMIQRFRNKRPELWVIHSLFFDGTKFFDETNEGIAFWIEINMIWANIIKNYEDKRRTNI